MSGTSLRNPASRGLGACLKPSIAPIAACMASAIVEKSTHWRWNVLLRRVRVGRTSHKRCVEAKNRNVVIKARIPFAVGSVALSLRSTDIKASK